MKLRPANIPCSWFSGDDWHKSVSLLYCRNKGKRNYTNASTGSASLIQLFKKIDKAVLNKHGHNSSIGDSNIIGSGLDLNNNKNKEAPQIFPIFNFKFVTVIYRLFWSEWHWVSTVNLVNILHYETLLELIIY